MRLLTVLLMTTLLWGCSKSGTLNVGLTDPFIGNWTSQDLQLVIIKIDDSYIIQAHNPTGMLNGEFPATRNGNRLETHQQLVGDVTLAGGSLFWAGATLKKAE